MILNTSPLARLGLARVKACHMKLILTVIKQLARAMIRSWVTIYSSHDQQKADDPKQALDSARWSDHDHDITSWSAGSKIGACMFRQYNHQWAGSRSELLAPILISIHIYFVSISNLPHFPLSIFDSLFCLNQKYLTALEEEGGWSNTTPHPANWSDQDHDARPRSARVKAWHMKLILTLSKQLAIAVISSSVTIHSSRDQQKADDPKQALESASWSDQDHDTTSMVSRLKNWLMHVWPAQPPMSREKIWSGWLPSSFIFKHTFCVYL